MVSLCYVTNRQLSIPFLSKCQFVQFLSLKKEATEMLYLVYIYKLLLHIFYMKTEWQQW